MRSNVAGRRDVRQLQCRRARISGDAGGANRHARSGIDTDVATIDVAREFGFKVYCGDGMRLDILHAAGAGTAREAREQRLAPVHTPYLRPTVAGRPHGLRAESPSAFADARLSPV